MAACRPRYLRHGCWSKVRGRMRSEYCRLRTGQPTCTGLAGISGPACRGIRANLTGWRSSLPDLPVAATTDQGLGRFLDQTPGQAGMGKRRPRAFSSPGPEASSVFSRSPGSRLGAPGRGLGVSSSRLGASSSGLRVSESRTRRIGFQARNAESKARRAGFRARKTELRTRRSEFRTVLVAEETAVPWQGTAAGWTWDDAAGIAPPASRPGRRRGCFSAPPRPPQPPPQRRQGDPWSGRHYGTRLIPATGPHR
jgi:hypothetical protein